MKERFEVAEFATQRERDYALRGIDLEEKLGAPAARAGHIAAAEAVVDLARLLVSGHPAYRVKGDLRDAIAAYDKTMADLAAADLAGTNVGSRSEVQGRGGMTDARSGDRNG